MKNIDRLINNLFDRAAAAPTQLDAMESRATPTTRAVEGFHLKKGDIGHQTKIDRDFLAGAMDCAKILPFAADTLKISPDIGEYIIQPIEIIRSEIPNKNGAGFLFEELTRHNYEYGRLSYQTWKGMPTFVEHQDNRRPENAAGIILDVALRPAPEFQGRFYRLNQLLAFDRNKRPDIASAILRGERTSFSMGSMCEYYTCSICSKNVNDLGGYCEHIDVRTPRSKAASLRIIGNKLAYCQPRIINGIETSSVSVPAAAFASNPNILLRPVGA